MIYDFTGEPGGSVSFAGETGLELTFAYINSYGFMGRTFLDSFVDIYTTGGDLQALPVPYDDLPGGTRTDFVPFSLFTGSGDLSHVTGLRIWFNDPLTTPRIDYTLTNLRTVPEPSAFVMLAMLGVIAALASARSTAARSARGSAVFSAVPRTVGGTAAMQMELGFHGTEEH